MDSNNNATTKNSNIDIRDVANFLLGKIWIIALVVLCFAIIAFLWTNFFVQDVYTSTTEMFIISNVENIDYSGTGSESATNVAQNWSIGKQLTKTSSELIMGDYCDYVALWLNKHDPTKAGTSQNKALTAVLNQKDEDDLLPLRAGVSFYEFFGKEKISGAQIRSMLDVSSDDETCIVTVTASAPDPTLSCVISNAVVALFEDYINDFMRGDDVNDTTDYVRTTPTSSGKVPTSPSNANSTRNAIIFGVIGAILICAILVIIFIFDDKIKTPDDIEKQLGLSVLGAIPEIEEA